MKPTIIRVRSDNADFQRFGVLKTNRQKRYGYGEFIVEGVRNINEAVKNGWKFSAFIYSDFDALSDWGKNTVNAVDAETDFVLAPELMQRLSGKTDTSELIAVVKMRPDGLNEITGAVRKKGARTPMLALFDRPSNRGNLGTVIRSCDSLGVDGLIITGHAVDLYDPEVVTASMGSFFNVPCVRAAENSSVFDFIADMKREFPGFSVVGTTSHHMKPLFELDLAVPLMFMIGNETDGLCRAFKEGCDVLATIPMSESSSASSFNVGCAATVMFYEAVRQRLSRG